MHVPFSLRLSVVVGLLAGPAAAQDAARGAALYLQLSGGQPSCVECHGPDPLGNRNRLLTAAGGPGVIALAITKVGAMGYLADLLDERDRSDLSAYLALVNALEAAPVVVWPRVLEFGRVGAGAVVPELAVRLLNTGPQAVAVQPALAPAAGLSLRHDCPPQLAPAAACTAHVALYSAEVGRRSTALQWRGDADGLPQWVGVHARVEPAAVGALVADLPGPGLTLQAPSGQAGVAEFALVNAGVAALSLGAAAITGPGAAAFSLAGSACSTSLLLQPGDRCRLRITATAPAAGRHVALLQWRTDGANLPPLQLEVTADSGVAPAPSPASSPGPTSPPAPAAPSPSPNQAPTPSPAPAVPQTQGASGGCAVAWPGAAVDPLLPSLLLLALLALRLRSRGNSQPELSPGWRFAPAQPGLNPGQNCQLVGALRLRSRDTTPARTVIGPTSRCHVTFTRRS